MTEGPALFLPISREKWGPPPGRRGPRGAAPQGGFRATHPKGPYPPTKESIHTMAEQQVISITTEYIKLEALLKLANLVGSGGEAKVLIQEGQVSVNGDVCTMRGKKLRPGDRVTFQGRELLVQ